MRYTYNPLPLDRGARHIRLVSLLPGSGNLHLQFHTEATCLGSDAVEPFEALSYVWGSDDNLLQVKIVEKHGPGELDRAQESKTVSITHNLAVALQHLRLEDRPRILWIDAICIDQSDPSEKSHQVTFMGEIYKLARQVIVWLGPDADDSARALDVIKQIGSQVEVDWTTFNISSAPGASDPTLGMELEPFPNYFTALDAQAVESLFARTWFERVWVRQEVALAKSAVFQVGHTTLDRYIMQNAAQCFCCKTTGIDKTFSNNTAGTSSGSGSKAQATTPSPFARSFPVWLHYYIKGMRCGNPRDRVYGQLSLLRGLDQQSEELPEFLPDYQASVVDCYRGLALRHIKAERSLGILASCSLSYQTLTTPSSSIGRLPGLPSWVPDWSVDLDRQVIGAPVLGARSFLASASYLGNGTLRVAGVSCGTVSTASHIDNSSLMTMFRSLRKACLEHILFASRDSTYGQRMYRPTGHPWAMALSRVLTMDKFCESFEPQDPSIISTQTTFEAIHRLLKLDDDGFLWTALCPDNSSSPSDSPNPELVLLYRSIGRKLRGRKLFSTSEGHLGLAPTCIQPGDKICLLLGCEFAIALRPQSLSDMVPSAEEQFIVLGECFVPGLMAGEPLLGPLPPHVRLIMRAVDGEDDYQVCFLDTHECKATLQDPRVRVLEDRLSEMLRVDGTETNFRMTACDGILGEHGELRYQLDIQHFNMLNVGVRYFHLI